MYCGLVSAPASTARHCSEQEMVRDRPRHTRIGTECKHGDPGVDFLEISMGIRSKIGRSSRKTAGFALLPLASLEEGRSGAEAFSEARTIDSGANYNGSSSDPLAIFSKH